MREGTVLFDALVTLEAPDGCSVTLAVQARRVVATRDLPAQLKRLRSLISRATIASPVPILVTRYLPPPIRERLENDGIAYADATGNLHLATTSFWMMLASGVTSVCQGSRPCEIGVVRIGCTSDPMTFS